MVTIAASLLALFLVARDADAEQSQAEIDKIIKEFVDDQMGLRNKTGSPAPASKTYWASRMDECEALPKNTVRDKCVRDSLIELSLSEGKGTITDKIARFCLHQWPEDFSMEAFCREKQAKDENRGIFLIIRFKDHGGNPATANKVSKHCARQWYKRDIDAMDWSMFAFCVERQLESARRMGY